MIRYIICAFVILVNCSLLAQKSSNVLLELSGMPASLAMADSVKKGFRGLSVVNEKVIWISGQRGLVGRSTNGGTSFSWRKVKSYEKMDFRTLHAFSKKCAVIATAGTPASILRTTNGGKTWSEVYRSDDSLMFFDGVGFWDDNRGLIFGDPIKGRMFLMETFDGGKTWKEIPFADRPQLVEGEAAFAASGTTIRTLPGGHVYIATGGVKSRLWHSRDYGHHWQVFETPIIQGKPSQGIFSMAWKDTLSGVIVGGDYLMPDDTTDNCFFTKDGGRSWVRPLKTLRGYRSCVSYSSDGEVWFATGPTGSEIKVGEYPWGYIVGMAGANNVVVTKGLPLVEYILVGHSEYLAAPIKMIAVKDDWYH